MTTVPAKQPQEKDPPVITLLRSMEGQIAKALPKHLTADRMARIALTEIRKNPKLLRCDPYSVLGAIMQFSQLGLEIGGALGHAYLVPYGAECTPITGYKGQIELALRSGRVKSIVPYIVYPEDNFEEGVNENGIYIKYTATRSGKPRDPAKEALLFFAVARMDDGTQIHVVMEKWEVDKVRDGLRYKSNVWEEHYGEMAKKTVIRRLTKLLPQSPELVRANEIEDGGSRTQQPFIDLGMIGDTYELKEQPIGETEAAKPGEHKLPHEQKAEDSARDLALADFQDALAAFKDAGGDIATVIKNYDPKAVASWEIARIKAAIEILKVKMKGAAK